MPSSNVKLIEPIISEIINIKPKSVLEFGIGFGKWGFLIREYLDVCNRLISKDYWMTKIVGVEICDKYIGDLQKLIYDEVIIADVENLQIDFDKYDLFIAVDVFEHLHKDIAKRILENVLLSKCKSAIISVPLGDEWLRANKLWIDINQYEAHISSWNVEDFINYPYLRRSICVKDVLGDIGILIFNKRV